MVIGDVNTLHRLHWLVDWHNLRSLLRRRRNLFPDYNLLDNKLYYLQTSCLNNLKLWKSSYNCKISVLWIWRQSQNIKCSQIWNCRQNVTNWLVYVRAGCAILSPRVRNKPKIKIIYKQYYLTLNYVFLELSCLY